MEAARVVNYPSAHPSIHLIESTQCPFRTQESRANHGQNLTYMHGEDKISWKSWPRPYIPTDPRHDETNGLRCFKSRCWELLFCWPSNKAYQGPAVFPHTLELPFIALRMVNTSQGDRAGDQSQNLGNARYSTQLVQEEKTKDRLLWPKQACPSHIYLVDEFSRPSRPKSMPGILYHLNNQISEVRWIRKSRI